MTEERSHETAIASVTETLQRQFGPSDTDPTVATAPGRVNLVGGHTDYNDGFVLPAAINHRITAVGRPRDDDIVQVHTTSLNETESFSLSDLDVEGGPSPETPRWLTYVQGVVAEFSRATEDRPGRVCGLDLVVTDGVPLGAGLSSSAALELVVAAVVDEVLGLDTARADLAKLCWRAETGFVGLDCGIMDQYAVARGVAEHALFLDCRSETHELVSFDSNRARLLVVDTCVEHELAGSAYNDRVEECERATAYFVDRLDHEVRSLRDVSVAEFHAHSDTMPELLRRRARHVVTENDRVRTAARALDDGDLDRLGDLMEASHRSLRDDYEVSCTELDTVVEVLSDLDGVFGARMTGGGFGGSVVAVVEPDAVEDVAHKVSAAYLDRTGIECDVYRCRVDDGVTVVR